MENLSQNSRASQLYMQSNLKTRSGYEPSDTETDWQETPWHERSKNNDDLDVEEDIENLGQARSRSPLKLSTRRSAKMDLEASTPVNGLTASPTRRRHSKSPYKARKDLVSAHSPIPDYDLHENVSPLSPRLDSDLHKTKSGRGRHLLPYQFIREEKQVEMVNSKRKQSHRQVFNDKSRSREKSNNSHRSLSAPKLRLGEEQKNGERTPSPLPRNAPQKVRQASRVNGPSVGEIDEIVANAKNSGAPFGNAPNFESTESISPGDIFFSHDYAALAMQKIMFPKDGSFEGRYSTKTQNFPERNPGFLGSKKANGSFNNNFSSIVSKQTTTLSSSAVSRQSSYLSDTSHRTSDSMRKFTENRRKNHKENWFFCIKKGSCGTPKRSPEKERAFNEASFIERAFVVESLRQFWADKHQPALLNGFICHKQEAQLLKQLVSHDICPHILLKGPAGSGKRALTMALLREIYGDTAQNISHDLRYFQVQELRPMQVVVPVTSSAHHVELNVYLESNARYALLALVKQISSHHALTPEISSINFKADYTVMVLYDVDKAAKNIQHLVKWIMDCYTDACKLILCCEDDTDIIEPVKNRCKIIKVDAPVTHEIMEVLIQIARKEEFDLPMSFAAKIAAKSKQNLRKAIMALEACRAHNYPFAEDQPIPMGWEEVLSELAAQILADPSQKRLFFIRGKFQKLLLEFVHPKLILQKLVDHFLKVVDADMKRELYYWFAYYDKRLPLGTSALLKLEEFVAKFMSIYRRSSSNSQYS